jgi:hypothetical protein
MPFKEAASWVCLTMIATASYFLFDWWGQGRIIVAVVVMLIGLVGLGYLVYQHHHPEAKLPSSGIWVWLPLVLTWCFLGYVIYVERTTVASPAEPAPAFISETRMEINKDVADRYISIIATVVGSATADKYGKNDSIFVFCLIGDSRIDPGSDNAIDRSKPFDLEQRAIEIEVPLGNENTQRVLKSGTATIYLVMVPKTVDVSNLTTLKDILSRGGRLLDQKGIMARPETLKQGLNGH